MNYYMAPLEGITGYVFRNAWHRYFGGMDKYFTPFISPNRKKICRTREKKDILPEHNKGMAVVPQILTNCPQLFVKAVDYLKEYGYDEVNLNLGCPAGTVVAKKKGAGMLSDRERLRTFLDGIFSVCDIKISIKTRIGLERADEFEELVDLFSQFPLYELIIHPRTREDYYENTPDLDAFSVGYEKSRTRVCYNGDIFTVDDYASITERFPGLAAVMLGRGLLRDPGLIGRMKDGTVMQKDTLNEFCTCLCEDYRKDGLDDKAVLFKMKELWSYLIHSFQCTPDIKRGIMRAQRLSEYDLAVRKLFAVCELSSI